VNVADVLPAGTAMNPGTVTEAVLLESATVPPPVFESVTVQVVEDPLVNVALPQFTPLIATAVVKAIEADWDPFNVAVMVAL
jgi:hypothetical protein